MIDIGIRTVLPLVRIGVEVAHHIFVNFLLKIYSYCPITSYDFIRAHPGIGRNIAAWIWNADVIRYISHLIMSAFDGGGNESANKILM